MMDHKDHLDFQVNEVVKESKDTRETQVQLDLKDQLVLLDLLVYLENSDARVNQELLVNVDLLVYPGKMDNVDQSDPLAQSDPKDQEVLLAQEEFKDSVDHVEDLDDKDLLVNHQVTKKFWRSVAALSKTRLPVLWPHSDQRASLLDHLVHQVILVSKVTKDLLAHQDHLEPTVFKANLDYKELAEFLDLKVPSEAKETKELPLLDQPERLAYLDHLVLKVLLVMEGMVAMVKMVHLD